MPAAFVSAIEAIFRMHASDAADLAKELQQSSVRAYNATINAQLQALGQKPEFVLRNSAELRRLREQATETARGIAASYNADLAARVDAVLAAEGTRGLNRRTLARRLHDWDRERSAWKAPQIARTEGVRVAAQAAQAFVAHSRLEDQARFLLVPAASDHDDLNDRAAAAGRLLTATDPALLELPCHPGERHSPVMVLPTGTNLEAAWMGG